MFKRLIRYCSICFFLVFCAIKGISQNVQQITLAKRTKACFDFNWQFHKGDIAMKRQVKAGQQGGLTDINVRTIYTKDTVIDYTDPKSATIFYPKDWKEIDLPHDWAVEGTFVDDNSLGSQPAGNGYLPTGIGFYRKEFVIPASDTGRKISIEFDGIFRNSTVWVNGHLLGNHQSGYTPSNYDLTDYLRYGKEGKNVILVRVDASQAEGWWYEGAGIYRHVWLIKTGQLHVGRFGTYVTTPVISTDSAQVHIKTTIKNEYGVAKKVTLVSKIIDKDGVVHATETSTQEIGPFESSEIAQQTVIKAPLLWSPETPHLYKVLTEVREGDHIADTYETTFGVRSIDINRNGVFLNGRLYPIKGTCNHQDFAGIGVALPDKINRYKLMLLKAVGSNAYRCSHNPPTPELLDMCDSLGMLVLDENRLLSSNEAGLKDLSTMLYRDRNHPCVFMWSMENEEPLEGTVTGARILETMVKTAHAIDPSRKVTAAMNHGRNSGGYSDVLDVVGYNYGDKGLAYVKDHEQYPGRVEFCTESTSFVSTRGEYENNWGKGYVSNMEKWQPDWGPFPGEDWADIVKYPYLGGFFVWSGFDYRGEPTPYQWPCVTSHFGFMDICGFPKDGYFAYKAAWDAKPLVHLFPHWNWPGKDGSLVKVQCYTNCEEVELLLNGKSMGRKKAIPFEKLEWPLVYHSGRLEALGYKAGKVVTKDVIETTTSPSAVAFNSDCTILKADGCDVAVIKVSIKDSKGRVVPVADNLVTFSIEGPGKIIGTGNGNPSSHEADKASQRKAFNGYCLVLVQSYKQAGEIRLKAFSKTLKGDELIIKVQ
nr:beta-galactosidase GalA [Mucilaginibacter sp. X5P1]